MPKIKLFVVVTLLFSFLAGVFLSTTQAQSESTQKTIIDENYLTMSYEFEEKAEEGQLLLKFKRRAEDKKVQQRLKIKLIDEKNKPIKYQESAVLKEDGGWLVEKEFSVEQEEQMAIKLAKSIKELHLYVQMDQKSVSEETDGKFDENILKQKTPYVLKLKDEKQTRNSLIKKAGTKEAQTTASSKGLIGPQKEQGTQSSDSANTPINSENRMVAPIYDTFVPTYTPDGTGGQYPTNAWSPTDQSTVMNHQGGYADSKQWDGNQGWDVANDNYTQFYIKYGDPNIPNLSLRKYAQATTQENEFKVKLNVKE